MRTSGLTNRHGNSLIEIMVSIAILGILLAGITSFASWSMRFTETEANRSRRNVENFEASKMLAQASYFGALSSYSENSNLKACVTDDSIICDSTIEQDIVLFDLIQKKKISLVSTTDPNESIKNKVSFKAHCANNEASCDRAKYFTVSIKTYLSYMGASFAPIERSIIVEPHFDNMVTFIPDAAVSPGRPANVVIFVDSSNSMLFAKNQIKSGVTDLIDRLSEMNVKVGIFDLRDLYSMGIEYYYYDAMGVKVNMPLFPSDRPDSVDQYVVGEYYYAYTSAPTYNFKKSDSASERANTKAVIANYIENLFDTNVSMGYDVDTSLCSLVRLLETEKGRNLFDMNAMTPTVVYLITNENDESKAYHSTKCMKSETTTWEKRPPGLFHSVLVEKQEYSIQLKFKGLKDGAPFQYTGVNIKIPVAYDPNFSASYSFCIGKMNTLTQNIEASIAHFGYVAGSGFTIVSCDASKLVTLLRGLQNSTDAMAAEECKGYADNFDTLYRSAGFVPDTCKFSSVSTGGGWNVADRVTTGYFQSEEIAQSVYESIQHTVGLSNFFFIPVVHPDLTTCTMTDGAEVGTEYVKLAKKDGVKSSVTPICSSSYSAKLNEVTSWMDTVGVDDLVLPATIVANFNGVEIVTGDKVFKPVAEVDYKLNGDVLVFRSGLVQANSVIKVYLK